MKTSPKNNISDIETILILLCATQVLHEKMDDLQHLKFYRHSLKQTAKRFETELTKVCDHIIKDIFFEDEETFNLIMQGIEEVGKELASLDAATLAKIALTIQEQKTKNHDLEGISPSSGEDTVSSV